MLLQEETKIHNPTSDQLSLSVLNCSYWKSNMSNRLFVGVGNSRNTAPTKIEFDKEISTPPPAFA